MIPAITQTIARPTSFSRAEPLTYQQLDILHSLRGFCAFYVVVFHAKFILWAGGRQYLASHPRMSWSIADYLSFGLDLLSSSGYEMVIFFFVLSGFFIRYAQHKKHRDIGAFYINRAVRIYPPFLVSLLLAGVALTVVATKVPAALQPYTGRELNTALTEAWAELRTLNLAGVVRALLFLPLGQHYPGDNVVYWSLLPEAVFYLLVPLAFWRIRWYYAASGVLFIVGMYCEWQQLYQNALLRYTLQYNAYFAAGVGLYDVVVCTNWLNRLGRLPRWLVLPSLVALLLLLVGVTLLKIKVLPTVVAGVLALLSVSALLAGQVSARNALVRLMHWMGEFSFSLYLYHYPLLLLLYAALVSCTSRLFVYNHIYWLAIPVVVTTCYGLYWMTERLSVRYFRK